METAAFSRGPRVVRRLPTYNLHRQIPSPPLAQGRNPTDLLAVSNAWIGAATTLAGSSAVGFALERNVIPNSGILSTLLVAAFSSNVLHLAPTTHALYDFCWTTLLPGSLALLLLSMKPRSKEEQADGMIPQSIFRVAPGFFFASLGSLVGCFLSFAMCLRFPSTTWLLSPQQALHAAACLLASYIGGTVNFFATAAAIPHSSASLLSAMAGADIMVMAVYFAALSAMLKSRQLRALFTLEKRDTVPRSSKRAEDGAFDSEASPSVLGVIPSLGLAFLLVEMAKRCESILSSIVPGTACAFLAGGIPLMTQRLAGCQHPAWLSIQQTSEPLSGFLFLFLFASIGVTADLRVALQQGPACLVFAGTALALHGAITMVGAWLWQRVPGSSSRYSLEDVLIASNAAIGGPATAAAFCGQIKGVSESRKLGQTIAATIWGVVGYATGTTLGISFFRLLRWRFVVQ